MPIGHARQRSVLAVLLLEANRVVSVDGLLDRVWGERPPSQARSVLRTYVSRLRRALVPIGVTITRRDSGYVLAAEPGTVDVHRFHRLLALARETGDPRQALALVENAMALWRGEPLAGLQTSWAHAVRERLRHERFAAETDQIDWRLQHGLHSELLPELTVRAAVHPLDERVAGQFMLALYRSGRQADALEHYQRVRTRLVDDLGTDPGPRLQRLHEQILQADPELTVPADTETESVAPSPVPRQLPMAPRSFTGRTDELAALTAALDTAPADQGAAVLVSAIGGAGGIGKTWLALHWAHHNADRFPDGQLFVDLHGFSPTNRPVEPDDAVRGFLTALGVAPDRIADDLDAKAALYRSLVAGKRMLVVLDNAATTDQVAPLLPGTPTCTVLVTGRTRLASLIDRYGARHVQLDVLTADEARVLLTGRLGAERVAAEPDATDDLIDLCGRYPLALSIVTRHAHTRPHVPLAEFAAELRELGLDMLDHHDDPAASLPTVLSWSLHGLTAEQRTMFALLGITPGSDTTLPAVVSLTCLPPARAHRALSALEEASLIERRPHGRYAMHDLVRDYAATTAHTTLPDDVREAALVRVMDFYLHTAHTADRLLNSHRPLVQLDPPAPGVHPHPLLDAASAMAWLDAEHATLLVTQRAAVALGRHHVVWHLAWTLDAFYRRRGHRRDALAAWRAALDAAAHLPDPTTRIHAHRNLGHACSRLGLHEDATGHLDRALALAVRHRDATEQAYTHRTLAAAWGERGDDRRALDHARHALDLHRTLDLPVREADAINAVGWFAARLGEFDTARDHCRAALTMHRHHHNLDGEAHSLGNLGYIAHNTGRYHQALAYYRQSIDLLRRSGDTYYEALAQDWTGQTHAALGRHAQARKVWREALKLYRQQGRDTDAERMQRQLDALEDS
ncbi:AfsR/SARP family transcriptional regulator [Saccharothrix sp. ALI-22-I]|uniref:AfsR/SARP family transcriptional regulator n=1 Tax=Saccharothrix sp. ALI-22-I TaxID=1933778 RepID=UPI001EE6AD58|nr:BTAD domain-containing putative transcriptional regulator [Saccharothrix sp. ALI-22-I]